MLNINAFQPVIHENIFEDLSKLSLFCSLLCPKRAQPLYLNTIPISQEYFLPSLVEIGQVVLEKKSFKGKS